MTKSIERDWIYCVRDNYQNKKLLSCTGIEGSELKRVTSLMLSSINIKLLTLKPNDVFPQDHKDKKQTRDAI